jgi:hypothetical protein
MHPSTVLHPSATLAGAPAVHAAEHVRGMPPIPYPWPDEAPPAARRPSPWRWLYLPASLAVALVVADPDANVATRIGYALAVLAGSAAVAALFYVWRASTRPAIPGTTFILAFLITGCTLLTKEDSADEETEALRRSADLFTVGSAYASTDEGPPMGVDARWIWASRKAMEDVAMHYHDLASSRDVIPGREPDGWRTAAYVADADEYPEVRRYFTAYRQYLAKADSSTLPVYFDRLHDRLMQAGFSRERARLMAASVQVGAAAAMKARREEFRLAGEVADSALAFHALLVRADSRVHYERAEDAAGFERESERLRAIALNEEIDRLTRRLDALREPARARLKALRRGE